MRSKEVVTLQRRIAQAEMAREMANFGRNWRPNPSDLAVTRVRTKTTFFRRACAIVTGIFIGFTCLAAADLSPDSSAISLVNVADGTVPADPASISVSQISPAGTAVASSGGSGPQGAALVAATQSVTSAGRTAGQFSVTPTGAAMYNVPLWTPPGARELEPHLALRYLSGGPDGPLGPGWSLVGTSAIARCGTTWASSNGNPTRVTLSTSDDLCLDGNRLRLVSGTQGVAGSTYQTELANFSNVTAYGSSGNGPAYFIAQAKDGRYYEYGNSADSKILAGTSTTPYTWGLSKIRDRQSNSITFTYNAGSALTLSKIQYTATPGTSSAAPYEIDFGYAARDGGTGLTKYVAGYAVTQTTELTSVTVLNNSTTVRKYSLAYAASPTTNRPMLQSIQECGGSSGTDCLRPTNITYQAGSAGWSSTLTSTGFNSQYGYFAVDLNGDGLPDALYGKQSGSNIQWYAKINSASGYGAEISTGATTAAGQNLVLGSFLGNGKMMFLAPVGGVFYAYAFNGTSFTSTSTGVAFSAGVATIDWDGDGLPDLLSYAGSIVTVRRNTTTPGGSLAFASTTQTIFSITSPSAVFAATPIDLDGDGRGDLLLDYNNPGCQMACGPPTPVAIYSNGFSAPSTVVNLGSYLIPIASFGDLNGDGCTDIFTATTIFVSNCNRGFTAVSTGITNAGTVIATDWDGDGQTDLVYQNSSNNTIYVARSTGSGVAAPVSTGISTAGYSLGVQDVDGDGQPDLVFTSTTAPYAVSYRSHSGFATPPDLASTVADGFGMQFVPSYVPITLHNFTKGSGAVFPDVDFQGAMYAVSQFVASDGAGGTYTDVFWYWGARLNLQGRGFEGFATTREYDGRNGTYRITKYRQDFPFIGGASEVDTYQPDLATFMLKVVNTFASTDLAGTNCSQRCFPYIATTTTSHYEVGGSKNGLLVATDAATYTYDAFGNLTTTAVTKTDNDAFAGQQWTTTITNTITNDSSNWCLGRPTKTTTTKSAPGQTTLTRTVSHTIDYVNCRASVETIEPGDTRLQLTTNYGFDACGNTNSVSVVGLDQNGVAMPARTTTYSFGTRCQFAESTTTPLGQTQTGWNYGFGLKSSQTDPNGIAASWTYDNFGRQSKELRPDGTYTTWSYSDCVTAPCWGVSDLRFLRYEYLYNSAGVLLRTGEKFYDGLDRLRYDEGNRALGTWTNVATYYDAMGRKTEVTLPFSSSSNGYHQYSYDLLNRVIADGLYTSAGVAARTIYMAYAGDSATVTDPRGNATTKVADPTGKIRQLVEPSPGGTTNYTYDSFENLVKIVDATNVTSTFGYNIRGFKTSASDADTGSWSFTPDSLNELVSQTDAKNQVTTFVYDTLGRMVNRYEAESISPTIWTYGSSALNHNIGRLQSVSKPDGYAESYAYDSYGRPLTVTYTEDSVPYQFDYAYNTSGTVDTVTYPTSTSGVRWVLKNVYDAYGFLNKTQDNASGASFWVLNSTNDSSLPTNELLGNGVQVVSGYTPHTNEVISRTEGPGGNLTGLQNLSYTWDLGGNLQQRQDLRQGLTEAFVNDSLNRLSSSTLNGASTLTVTYDAAGNISKKSDVSSNNYVYGDVAHKHAVTSAGSWSMTYDANGNMITRAGGTISWYSYNLPNLINYNGNSSQFSYDAAHRRWKQVANYGGTVETTHYVGGMLEVMTRGSVTEYRHQVPAGSSTAIYTRRTDGTTSTYYATSDHLGSSDLILDSSANVVARESFTPFGARRGSNWQGVPTTSDYTAFSNTTRKGFTGHETLDAVSLVHMNGRVYDPYLGRFLSADSVVQSIGSSQAINPYAYAWNDPLRYIDPSGHDLLGAIVGIIAAIITAIIIIYTCGAGSILLTAEGTLSVAGSMVVGFVGGFVGTWVSTGNLQAALVGGLVGAVTAGLFNGVGTLAADEGWAPSTNVLAHAAVGCAAGVMSGGNCGRGAASAGLSEVATQSGLIQPAAIGTWGSVKGVAESGLVGGIAARIAGGAFSEGFASAAAGYLFNCASHPPHTYEIDAVADPSDGLMGHAYVGALIDGKVQIAIGMGPEGATTLDRVMNIVSGDGWTESVLEIDTDDFRDVVNGTNKSAAVMRYYVDADTYNKVLAGMVSYQESHDYVLGKYDCVSALGFALGAGGIGAPLNVAAMQWRLVTPSQLYDAISRANAH
ncbi:MAG: VCBS repeat-containing protein [Cyanobacteria bacterium SZAS LIN-2]|nr:VCBS repeat-containing protein [Cyanobacteria bacterium SZAS LIN-2]